MLSVKRFFVGCLLLMLVLICKPSAAFADNIQICNQSGKSQVYHVHELTWCHDIQQGDGILPNMMCTQVSVNPIKNNYLSETPKCAVDVDKADNKGHYYGVDHLYYTTNEVFSKCVVGNWNTENLPDGYGIRLTYKGRGSC